VEQAPLDHDRLASVLDIKELDIDLVISRRGIANLPDLITRTIGVVLAELPGTARDGLLPEPELGPGRIYKMIRKAAMAPEMTSSMGRLKMFISRLRGFMV